MSSTVWAVAWAAAGLLALAVIVLDEEERDSYRFPHERSAIKSSLKERFAVADSITLVVFLLFALLLFAGVGPMALLIATFDGKTYRAGKAAIRLKIPQYALMLSPILALGLLWLM